MRILGFILCLITEVSFSQKEVYIPLYLQDTMTVDGSQFTWSKTAQSDNFIVIWGDSVGLDPLSPNNPDLAFDPNAILDTLEAIYQSFIDYGFAQDIPGTNLHQFKIPVVMLNTFGPSGVTGWAFGGDVDGIIGAFWAHPLAMQNGHVAAHELAHSIQAQANIDYRSQHGLGPVWLDSGIFWETHANFMRNLLYPQDVSAWGMDLYHIETWGDWKNTYENYALLFAIKELHGIDIINRLWRESFSHEYPLQAYKRLMEFSQEQLNDNLFKYALRMATYDFKEGQVGNYFQQRRKNDLMHWLPSVQATWTILQNDTTLSGHYVVPIHLAPEEFAYNVIPIHPDPDSCAVLLKFKGHTDANEHAGWRYGFVSTYADGSVSRYSEMYALDSIEIKFELASDESNLYFVVMGAPKDSITTNKTNDTWQGYPKHFRFPYELTIHGGFPEGYQNSSLFRDQLKSEGSLHPNGGGWVENSASVSSTVYVAPHAIVLGHSNISGMVRIEHTALVKDANISDNVIVKNNALVIGGFLSDNVLIAGQGLAENNMMSDQALIHMRAKVSNYTLHGNIEVGGDVIVYNNQGDCDNGVYYRMTNYYQNNLLECDERLATHPANLDVNETITPFSPGEMALTCNCNNYPTCETVGITGSDLTPLAYIHFPNPSTNSINFLCTKCAGRAVDIHLYDMLNRPVASVSSAETHIVLNVSHLQPGPYIAVLYQSGNTTQTVKVVIQH